MVMTLITNDDGIHYYTSLLCCEFKCAMKVIIGILC